MLTLLTKSLASILLVTSFHNGVAIEHDHYVIVNNQIPKITQVTYTEDKRSKKSKIKTVKKSTVSNLTRNNVEKQNSFKESQKKPIKRAIIHKQSLPVKKVPVKKPIIYHKTKKVNKPVTQTAQNSHTVTMNVSAYTYSGGVNNGRTTASGLPIREGMIAAGSNYPFGTRMLINGNVYVVEDRGGAIGPSDIDIFMPTEQQCIQFGRQTIKVTILN